VGEILHPASLVNDIVYHALLNPEQNSKLGWRIGPGIKQFSYGARFFDREKRSPLISSLFDQRNPSAILSGVWATVVDAVNGMIRRWGASHIRKEVHVRIFPSFANINSTIPVVVISFVVFVVATIFYTAPGPVFFGNRASLAMAFLHPDRIAITATGGH
jgi:hypothetical protein